MACEEEDWLAHASGESPPEHTKTASCRPPVGATSLADIATPSWLYERRTAGLTLRNRQTRALIGFADTQTQQSAPKNMRFRLECRFFSISIRYASENAVFGW